MLVLHVRYLYKDSVSLLSQRQVCSESGCKVLIIPNKFTYPPTKLGAFHETALFCHPRCRKGQSDDIGRLENESKHVLDDFLSRFLWFVRLGECLACVRAQRCFDSLQVGDKLPNPEGNSLSRVVLALHESCLHLLVLRRGVELRMINRPSQRVPFSPSAPCHRQIERQGQNNALVGCHACGSHSSPLVCRPRESLYKPSALNAVRLCQPF
mmetsp:Transcript_29582/g.72979  ORF Transcript_29582/g.72979 Transcript_29582/m.72979 type:complete len:211 (-) Transcript_29582:258-890(-)